MSNLVKVLGILGMWVLVTFGLVFLATEFPVVTNIVSVLILVLWLTGIFRERGE